MMLIDASKMTDKNIPQSTAENQKVELDQNPGIGAFHKRSSADKYDFQLGRFSCATQENSTERYMRTTSLLSVKTY